MMEQPVSVVVTFDPNNNLISCNAPCHPAMTLQMLREATRQVVEKYFSKEDGPDRDDSLKAIPGKTIVPGRKVA